VAVSVGSIDSLDSQKLLDADSNAVYAEQGGQGYVLFLRGSSLMAQAFDATQLRATGEAVMVADPVQESPITAGGSFSASANGVLAYSGGSPLKSQLVWFDRRGVQSSVGDPAEFYRLNLSPDGTVALASETDQSHNLDLWLYDTKRGSRTRFTSNPATESTGIWSPDARSVVFHSNRNGHFDLYRKATDGTGPEELLYADQTQKYPQSWSPDGRFLVYAALADGRSDYDLWILPGPLGKQSVSKPFPFLHSEFDENQGQFSPDGKWIAYQSNESGRDEIYATPFPGPGARKQISTGGGVDPRWSRNGKEIFYLTTTNRFGKLMAVDIVAKGSVLDVGEARTLFGPVRIRDYDVSPDGQHFLALVRPEDSANEPLTVVQNWPSLLKK
jgi:dipeptidyl aminopeptidase/acylaminoacyl peptidase